MNGPHGHLQRLLEICCTRRMPLLTSLCVNKQGIATGELSEDALDGFVNGAKLLGHEITDRKGFLIKCQHECFEWGAAAPQSN
jgi:5-methylcytosine-specific restriction protein B